MESFKCNVYLFSFSIEHGNLMPLYGIIFMEDMITRISSTFNLFFL